MIYAIEIFLAIIASSGIWEIIKLLLERKFKKKDKVTELSEKFEETSKEVRALKESDDLQAAAVRGLLFDRIINTGMEYLNAGWISIEQLDSFNKYLWLPAERLGVDGAAKHVVDQVNMLPNQEPEKKEEGEK